jgi:hypothetical protein
MATHFDQFKQTLIQAVEDPDFRRKNYLFQDDVYLQNFVARINALTEDVLVPLGFGDITSVLGMVEQDIANNAIKFDTRGFDVTLSAFREGVLEEPRKIWTRDVAGSTDRYIVSDGVKGLMVLSQEVETLSRFPGFGTDLDPGNQYDGASACCTFTVGVTEYLAVVMEGHHVCHIYEYATGTFVSRIGTVDTAGSAANELDTPLGIAVDETNSVLYILCKAGQPTGATAPNGFVASYDVSTPATPTHVADILFYRTDGSLLDAEVDAGTDIFYEDGLLWVANGNDEVGAIDVSTTDYRCTKFIPAAGSGYTLHDPSQLVVHEGLGGIKSVFVANGAAGLVEKFDHLTLKHLRTYGRRALEDELNLLNRLSSGVYGAVGFAKALAVDRVMLDEEDTDVMICADTLNKRLHRFNLNSYEADNFANFGWLTFTSPRLITGWTVSGDIATDMVEVYFRFAETEDFRLLNCNAAGLPPTSKVQIRLAIKLDSTKFVRDWYIKDLVILGKQA